MSNEPKALIVRHCRVGTTPENPQIAIVRLSADKKGPHLDFVANAKTLNELGNMLIRAAKDIRDTAH